jgi:hypothetical protein
MIMVNMRKTEIAAPTAMIMVNGDSSKNEEERIERAQRQAGGCKWLPPLFLPRAVICARARRPSIII